MENMIIEVMNDFGYIGIGLLILIENLFPPIPSEVILTFGGFMTIESNMTILGVIIFSTIGSVLGAFILYYIGKIFNKERLKKLVTSKYGKYLRVKSEDIDSANKWFDKSGNKTVFFCRFIPVVRSLISIPAGMAEMPKLKFLFYTLAGSVIWNTALVYVGAFAGDKKDYILMLIDKASNIILIIIVLAFLIVAYYFYQKRSKKESSLKAKK